MAVRRLGQSVTGLLRQRNAGSPAAIRLCNAQQRDFADQPQQKDIDGIPVEVCMSRYTASSLHVWLFSSIKFFASKQRDYALIAEATSA